MLKKYLIYLTLSLVISLGINRLYEKTARPDALFFASCLEASRNWAEQLRKTNEPCYIFAGGSEVRMTIEPETMLREHNVRAVNAAGQAGNGARCNAQISLPFLHSGDTLIFSFIPGIPSGMSSGGISFCYSQQGPKALYEGVLPINQHTLSSWIMGDAQNYCMHLMRILTRPDCIFRYSSEQNARISKSGRVEVFLHKVPSQTTLGKNISDYLDEESVAIWSELMRDLQNYCKKKNVHLVVNLTRAGAHPDIRRLNAKWALFFIKCGLKVIKDPSLGAHPYTEDYSDTLQHMSIEGGRRYSSFLAGQLKKEQFWTEEELLQILETL